jgi:hypothetical protein
MARLVGVATCVQPQDHQDVVDLGAFPEAAVAAAEHPDAEDAALARAQQAPAAYQGALRADDAVLERLAVEALTLRQVVVLVELRAVLQAELQLFPGKERPASVANLWADVFPQREALAQCFSFPVLIPVLRQISHLVWEQAGQPISLA